MYPTTSRYATLDLDDGLQLRKAGYVNIATVYRIDKRDLPTFWTETEQQVARLTMVSTQKLLRVVKKVHGKRFIYADGLVDLSAVEQQIPASPTVTIVQSPAEHTQIIVPYANAPDASAPDVSIPHASIPHADASDMDDHSQNCFSNSIKHVLDFFGRQVPQFFHQRVPGMFRHIGGKVAGWFTGSQGRRWDALPD